MGLRAMFRLPAPDERVEQWHLSPLIDLSAYSLSWAWVLIPLLLLGPARADYLLIYIFTIGLTDLHRHFGLPYVYFDAQVRDRYPARFWLFPLLLLVAFVASPYLADDPTLALTPVSSAALASCLVLLLQVLRRDGGEAAVPLGELSMVLGIGGLAASALSWVRPLGLDPGWWWIAMALFASTFFDYQRLRRAAQPEAESPEASAPAEQAIATEGGPGFAASMLIVGLIGLALLVQYWAAGRNTEVSVSIESLLAAVGVFAALWNFWHVYMQKYGIMRMYNAKARGHFEADADEVPGWVDKALVLCWLPLYFAYLGPLYREIAVDYFDDASAVLPGFIDLLERAMPTTIPLTVALVILVHAIWIRSEWRATRLRSKPRLAMAAGTTGLALCFFVFDPVKVYLAFAFSHALEYCVFVWAFQRKRYYKPLAHQPLLGRLLRHPIRFYVGMIVVFAVSIALLKFYGKHIVPDAERPELLGFRTAYWLGFWGIYQSMVHFYFDGFLWKMRLPSVRANI